MPYLSNMADQSAAGSSGSSGTRSSRERAVNLLRVVQNLLERNDDVEQGRQSSQDEAGPSASGEQSSTRGEVVKNFRNLFASYSASSRSQSSRPPPAKRQKSLYVPKETWTHEFFCLADCARIDAPSRKEKLELQFAGLGRKKIVFGSKDSALQVKTKLEEEFPKLKNGGGFEILRSGFSPAKSLVLLRPPASVGYSVKFLRDESGLGQALAYIRPLQRSLDVSLHAEEEGRSHDEPNELPQVECINCRLMLPVTAVRQHMVECRSRNLTEASTSKEDSDDDLLPTVLQESTCDVAKLKEMFPTEEYSVLEETLKACSGDVNQAAAQLAGCKEDDDFQELTPVFQPGHNYQDLSATDTKLTSAPSSLQLDEGSTSHVLSLYKGKKEQGTVFIEVNRFQLSRLRQIMKIYKDPHFQLTKSPDVNFYNEQCADLGGPTKEFFHDAIACFVKVNPAFNIQLFGGLQGHFIPFYGVDAVASGCFEIAGKVVAHSILHDGPGFVGLAPCLREYLATGCVDTAKELVSLDDLPDLDLKHILEGEVLQKEVKDIDTSAKDKVEELMVRHGLSDIPLTDLNKDKAVNDLLVAEVIITCTLALDRFFAGLNCLGLGDLLRRYPVIKNVIFPSPDQVKVDPETLKRKLQQAKLRTTESCKEDTEQSWNWFLQFIEEAGSCEDESTGRTLITSLALFVTGSTIIDPQESFQVSFQTNPEKKLLEADTCFNRVIIPTSHESYEEFARACKLSIIAGSTGYGRF